jgi:c(7)-type cytochrome triheme protein
MGRNKSLMLATLVAIFLLVGLSCFYTESTLADSRDDLGRVLRMIPPNGSPEHYGNVVFRKKSKKAGIAPVVFPHWAHRAKYTCRVCHFELQFNMRRGDSGITRAGNLAGHYCGTCHNGKIAFTVKDGQPRNCERCHMKSLEDLDRRFAAFAETLPRAGFGNEIDWAKALNDGFIKPANTLSKEYTPMPLPSNLLNSLKLGTPASKSEVTFSHQEHYAELDCSSCHPEIFNIKKRGTELFSMEKNVYGSFCGTCHMRAAFPMNDCHRCHPDIKENFRF